jgi:TRAP-type C4-dicarboxylate transport system permease small subunit
MGGRVVVNGLRRLEHALDAVAAPALALCKWLTIVLLAAMLGIEILAVFCRYALSNALPWPEEVTKWLMVWMTFTGSPIALRIGAHAAIEILPSYLRGRAFQFLVVAVQLAVITLMLVLIKEGIELTWIARIQVGSATRISYAYIYAAIPFGSAIMLLVSVKTAVRALQGVVSPDQGVVPREFEGAGEATLKIHDARVGK